MSSIITRPGTFLATFLSYSPEQQLNTLRRDALLIDTYNHNDLQLSEYYYYGYFLEVTLKVSENRVSDVTPFKRMHILPSQRKTSAAVTRRGFCLAA